MTESYLYNPVAAENISAWNIEVEERAYKKGFPFTDHTEFFLQLDGNDSNCYFVDTMIHAIVVAIIAVKLKEEFRMASERETLLGHSLLNLYDPSRDIDVWCLQRPMVLPFLNILPFRMWRNSSSKKACVYFSSSP